MELFFSYLLFNVWRKESFSAGHTFGALLMLAGAVIILYPKQGLVFHGGDFLVLAATACAPIGNFYQQKLRKLVSSETIVFLRSIFAIPVFFALAFALKVNPSFAAIQKSFWFLAINGIIILGVSKLLWMEGIHRISVTKANALSSIAPLFTLLFAYIFLHQSSTIWQLTAFIPLAGGLLLLTHDK
jgi:drug/metabolite transporter (DMT)-like permease